MPLARFLNEAGNPDFTVATVPDVDHWMWVCTEPSEPGRPCPEMEFSPGGARFDNSLDPEALIPAAGGPRASPV